MSKQNGVNDGTRTRDNRNHNPGLYQLSYNHHFGLLTRAQPSDSPHIGKIFFMLNVHFYSQPSSSHAQPCRFKTHDKLLSKGIENPKEKWAMHALAMAKPDRGWRTLICGMGKTRVHCRLGVIQMAWIQLEASIRSRK